MGTLTHVIHAPDASLVELDIWFRQSTRRVSRVSIVNRELCAMGVASGALASGSTFIDISAVMEMIGIWRREEF